MKTFKVLKFLDLFRGLFEKIGVDYVVMRKILQIKLIMDGRRVPTLMSNNRKKATDEDSNNFMKSLFLYGLMGIFLVPLVVMGKNFVFQMSLVNGIVLFMIMSSLISDFSAVLLDIRDKNILFTKPINTITINMAKSLHIFIYMFSITIAMTGLALIAGLVRHGILFFLVFAFEILLINLFVVVISALLYLLVLKFFDGEKLKDVINYFQIALSITLAVGYQLIGRLFNLVDMQMVFQVKWWQYFIIPMWFSGPFEVLMNGDYSFHFILFSLLALFVPILSIVVYIQLIPTFEANLQKLNNNSSSGKVKQHPFGDGLANFLCSDPVERTFYRFATKMITKEREFKLKVYPSIGLALVLPFLFIFSQISDQSLAEIGSGKMYFNIYLCALLLPTILMMMKYSGAYKGAWIYQVMPIKNIAPVYKGTIKAMVVKLMLPILLLQSGIFMLIFGTRIALDLVIVFLNISLFMIMSFKMIKKGLPFSEPFAIANQSEGMILLPLMLMLSVFAGIHFACSFSLVTRLMLSLVLIALNILLWKIVFAKIETNRRTQ